MAKITVKDTDVTIIKINDDDYISITDMLKAKDGDFFVSDWLRNRNTLEYIGIWEKIYNPNFNYGEFAIIRNQAGLNNFKISVKEFSAKTNAICLQAKAGRYGGTYAHEDIALEFASWISAEFKFYLITEFKRLKKRRTESIGLECKARAGKNQLSYPHRCHQTKSYSARTYASTNFTCICQRGRCAEHCAFR